MATYAKEGAIIGAVGGAGLGYVVGLMRVNHLEHLKETDPGALAAETARSIVQLRMENIPLFMAAVGAVIFAAVGAFNGSLWKKRK